MKPNDVLALIGDDLAPKAQRERARLDEIDKWLTSENPVEQHRRAQESAEKHALADLSRTPLLRLVVEVAAQQMILEGAVSDRGEAASARIFEPFNRNGLPSRQGALYKASLGYGLAYETVLPGVDATGAPRAVIKPMSPRDLFAVWGDDIDDEWPLFGLRTIPQAKGKHYRLIDEQAVHYVAQDETGRLIYLEAREHGAGAPPIVRYANDMDLEGRTPGEVDKFKGVAGRFEKTTNDRLLIQHYNSWRIKTATNMEEPGSEDEKERVKALLRHEDILTGGEGVTFGSLPETSMDGVLRAGDTDRDTLAAVSQTPVWAFNGGQLVNLSADALSEARSTSRQKVNDKKRALGRARAQSLRLAAHVEGRTEDAADFSLRMEWADVESQALGQAADALGKISTQLRVPPEMLWDMIPGVSKGTADAWRDWVKENPSDVQVMAAALERQTGTPVA